MKLIEKRYFWHILLGITIVAMTISFLIGMQQSIWFDEAYSIMVAKQPLNEIVRLVGLDTHPPLYYALLHGWGVLFDWNTAALRLLSVLGFGGSIIMAGLLVRRLFGAKAALAAALMVILSPLLIRYGFEIRMYSWASCIGISATYVLIRAYQAKRNYRWWALYAVLVALGMYTLYYLALLWITHAVWLAWNSARTVSWRSLHTQPWLRAYVAAVVLFLPWLPTFIKQTGNGALAPIGQPMNLENLLGVLTFNTLYKPVWQMSMLDTVVFLALMASVIYLVWRARRTYTGSGKQALGLLVAYIAVPILVLMVVSFSRSMYVERYLSHIAIAIPMLLGITVVSGLTKAKSSRVKLATAVIVSGLAYGAVTVAFTGNFNYQRMSKPDVAAISKFAENCHDNAAVVAADPYVAIELAAHLPASCPLYFYSDSTQLSGGYAPLNGSPRQLTSTSVRLSNPRIYYVYYDQPKLTISNLKQTTTVLSDNLHIALYRR